MMLKWNLYFYLLLYFIVFVVFSSFCCFHTFDIPAFFSSYQCTVIGCFAAGLIVLSEKTKKENKKDFPKDKHCSHVRGGRKRYQLRTAFCLVINRNDSSETEIWFHEVIPNFNTTQNCRNKEKCENESESESRRKSEERLRRLTNQK